MSEHKNMSGSARNGVQDLARTRALDDTRDEYFRSLRQDCVDYRAGKLKTVSLDEMKAFYGLKD